MSEQVIPDGWQETLDYLSQPHVVLTDKHTAVDLIKELGASQAQQAQLEDRISYLLASRDFCENNLVLCRAKVAEQADTIDFQRLQFQHASVAWQEDIALHQKIEAENMATIERLTRALEKAEIGLMLCNPLSGYDMATLHIVRAALSKQEPK